MTNPLTYEYDVFISYNQNDESWAKQLATRLEQEDWQGKKLKVFFAPWDIKPGDSILERLEYALPRSRKVCLIMSPESDASSWVKIERYITLHIDITERHARLIPLYRRASDIPTFLQHINRIDFQDDAKFEDNYRVLLITIKDEPLPCGEQRSETASALSARVPRPPVVGFVARRDSEGHEIVERLKEELAPEKNQLIVLSGPGGVGKTTLAAETTRALTDDFEDRIVWIGALGREDFAFSTLLDEIATQLARPDLRSLAPDPKAEKVEELIASATPLIILDNFETIATAEQTRCVEFLLNRASCPALITTRQKIAGARNITIPVMLTEEADEFLNRLIDQASDASAFARLDRDRLMEASDRNPLIMQWVIGQIDLAQEATTVLDELAQGGGDAAQRVFDRSFGLEWLGDDGRATLLALSLFAPDASRPGLAEVAGFGQDLKRLNEALKRLAGLWLVKTAAGGQRLTVEGLTRELAKSHLMKDERLDAFRRRFVAYFHRYAKSNSRPTAEDYEVLEAEKDNLLASMDVASNLEDSEIIQAIAEIVATPVTGMLPVRGYWDEALRCLEQALEWSRLTNSEFSVAQFAGNAAIIYQMRGEYDAARRTFDVVLLSFKELGSDENVAVAIHQLATLAYYQGQLEEARRLYNESLEIKKKLGDQLPIASTLHQLAILAQDQGDLPEARRLYNESLEIKKKLGDQRGIAITMHELGRLAQAEGDLPKASRLYNESLEIYKKLGDQSGIAGTLHELGRLAQAEGNLSEARRLLNEGLEINKKLGNQSGIAFTLGQLGKLAVDEDDKVEAARLFGEALTIFEKLNSPNAEIARRDLARVEGETQE